MLPKLDRFALLPTLVDKTNVNNILQSILQADNDSARNWLSHTILWLPSLRQQESCMTTFYNFYKHSGNVLDCWPFMYKDDQLTTFMYIYSFHENTSTQLWQVQSWSSEICRILAPKPFYTWTVKQNPLFVFSNFFMTRDRCWIRPMLDLLHPFL